MFNPATMHYGPMYCYWSTAAIIGPNICTYMLLDPICTYIMEYISCPIYRCQSAAAISSNPALIAFACQCWRPVLLAPVLDPVACTSVGSCCLHQCAQCCSSVQCCLQQCWILCTEHCAQCCTVFQQCAVCTVLQKCVPAHCSGAYQRCFQQCPHLHTVGSSAHC